MKLDWLKEIVGDGYTEEMDAATVAAAAGSTIFTLPERYMRPLQSENLYCTPLIC